MLSTTHTCPSRPKGQNFFSASGYWKKKRSMRRSLPRLFLIQLISARATPWLLHIYLSKLVRLSDTYVAVCPQFVGRNNFPLQPLLLFFGSSENRPWTCSSCSSLSNRTSTCLHSLDTCWMLNSLATLNNAHHSRNLSLSRSFADLTSKAFVSAQLLCLAFWLKRPTTEFLNLSLRHFLQNGGQISVQIS